jgi:hypothetical protein
MEDLRVVIGQHADSPDQRHVQELQERRGFEGVRMTKDKAKLRDSMLGLTALAAYGERRWTCCGALRQAGEDTTQECCPACVKWNADWKEAVYGRND